MRRWGVIAVVVVLAACATPAVQERAALPGLQTGAAPWLPETATLRSRLSAIGLPALEHEGTIVHTHQHLDIIVNGRSIVVPANIGINQTELYIAPIHTHDETGILHVESDDVRSFTLGQFFDIWGVRFDATCLGGYCTGDTHRLRVFVNGLDMPGDPRSIELEARQQIAVVYAERGTSVDVPSVYRFPSGY